MPHILIVDDEKNNLYMLSALLKGMQHRVTEATNGQEALAVALQDIPDLVVSDILMPEMDGYDLCRAWRTLDQLKHVPFLFYSATYTDPADIEFALNLGADEFLIKPSEPETLLKVISGLLARKPEIALETTTPADFDRIHKERISAKLSKKIRDLALETEKRQLLQHERSLLISGIEHTTDAVMVTDAQGIIKYTNPAFEVITGFTADEIRNQETSTLRKGLPNDSIYKDILRSLVQGGAWHGQIQKKRKNDELFTVDITISPVFSHEGELTHFVAVMRDITEILELERQLRHAQKMESVGVLAGGIAHDFNNVLFAILGNAELAKDVLDDDNPAMESICEIIQAGRRAENLVKQILTFARKSQTTRGSMCIELMVKEALNMLRSAIPATIEISYKSTANKAFVIADPSEIHQVVMNLCTNALQAMPEDGGRLELAVSHIDCCQLDNWGDSPPEYGCIELLVSDTGPGIDPAILDHIFEPFFTTKEAGKGTGMGLAVVHGIIRDLGGKIDVDSVLGKGTTFKVQLPATTPLESSETTAERQPPKGSGNVLVIDDDEMVSKVVAGMLKDLGYSFATYRSSLEGLNAYFEHPDGYDIVITDQTMPIMTGEEVARRILERFPDQPVVLCSGYEQDPPVKEKEIKGLAAFIRKPVTLYNLADTLAQIMK